MAFKFSTGLRNALLKTGSLKSILDGGFLHIYGGTVPVDADAAPDTILATMYGDGGTTPTGLTFADPGTGALLNRTSAEDWDNSNLSPAGNVAGGVATHFMFVDDTAGNEDGATITASTTEPRILGTVGGPGSGADLILSDTTLAAGEVQAVNSFFVSIPESV